ncbi:MAG: type II CRISPR RNA-guided endonuclease Cas9 [Bacteroidales bacterium]|nr:type II CRISPR RNA-guided endonuclease Cas9 [Bacteroidales bacterium]
MKRIIGLDLGTNSIGWAVVDKENHRIEAAGSRIIPMDAARIGDFEKGNSVSATAERTKSRGIRRLYERRILRRERLLRVLQSMDFLPKHYADKITRYGKFADNTEPKLAWKETNGTQEFVFQSSFEEMINEFQKKGINQKIPYDWTIYYLRKKALTQPITKEELSWVLLQFNQKRGYNQLRGKTDETLDPINNPTEEKEYIELKITNIEDSGERDKKGVPYFNITLENGWTYRRPSYIAPEWIGMTRPFIATFKIDKDGNRKNEQPSLKSPDENDWGLQKIKAQHNINKSGKTVGEHIYDLLLSNPSQKIIGETVRTIDRHYYLDELRKILKTQTKFHPELQDRKLYQQCIEELYRTNEAYRKSIANRDFTYLLADDILFYQRPLKSKKSLIVKCPFEHYSDGHAINCIAKSHPLFQEFRIWQFISNLRIYKENRDVTQYLFPTPESYTDLYDYLSTEKSIKQETLLKHLKIGKKELSQYRWNYVQDKEYPMGETRAILLNGFKKAQIDIPNIDANTEKWLWHILYSIDDQTQYEKALRTFFSKQKDWDKDKCEAFVQVFRKTTIYKEKDYGAYSAKAIKRLLPLMRRGQYWDAESIDKATQDKIEHIITGEYDDSISSSIREKFSNLKDIRQCQGLNTWQACYLVYGRHSEAIDAKKWTSPEDIDIYLNQFRHNSLNNPVVEQVVTESLRVVRDIWKQFGRPNEIHIELGRQLNKTKTEREKLSNSIAKGEATNQRIRLLLTELMNSEYQVENVRPHSQKQQELLKIYEEGVFCQPTSRIFKNDNEQSEIEKIHKRLSSTNDRPNHSDILRYKLWLDQKYVSPYTGKTISLSKLFTSAYEIEHIIPQSRWFDDSLSNKVICEAEVNKLKDRELGHEFIVNHHGERVTLNGGNIVEILSVDAYEKLVKEFFQNQKKGKNLTKYEKLMLDDIPEGFTARQMNDTNYISRLMMHLLSNIVRDEDENGNREETLTSKNVIPCIGQITDRLKHDWGINDVWNQIVLPRFERMNQISNSSEFTAMNNNGHPIPAVPLRLRQGFNKKRIDHRHHAMDAIVIACCTREHINLLNNEAAEKSMRYDLQNKLRKKEYYTSADGKQHETFTSFVLPWQTFSQDIYQTLQNIVVSFKQNLRVINKNTNYTQTVEINGKHHQIRKQEKGDNWAIRRPLHKDSVFGEVNLQLKKKVSIMTALDNINAIVNRELKAKIKEKKALRYTNKQIVEFLSQNKDIWSEAADGKIEVYFYTKDTGKRYFAIRKDLLSLMTGCDSFEKAEKTIESITDSGIQSILLAHLTAEGRNPSIAFSADGLERMNRNIKTLNRGRDHMPIRRVRVYEQANKFRIGKAGQKATKFVEAAKGTNLFFVIYTTNKGDRGFETIPLNTIIDLQKRYEKSWKEHLSEVDSIPKDAKILHVLSPGDLVYVPESDLIPTITSLNPNRIYNVVSMQDYQLFCLNHRVASFIVDKSEFSTLNKMERATSGEMIKKICLPIHVDRLGNITKLG